MNGDSIRDELTWALDDLRDLTAAAVWLTKRSAELRIRATERELKHLRAQLRAATTRLVHQPRYLHTAQAYIEVAAERLATIACRIGESAHAHR